MVLVRLRYQVEWFVKNGTLVPSGPFLDIRPVTYVQHDVNKTLHTQNRLHVCGLPHHRGRIPTSALSSSSNDRG